MTDPLIDKLVNDLTPRDPLVNKTVWIHCSLCLFILTGVIVGFLGFRFDAQSAFLNGTIFWKSGMFLAGWIGSLLLMTDISRPGGRIKPWHTLLVGLTFGILIWQIVSQLTGAPLSAQMTELRDASALYCLSIITGAGAVVLFLTWRIWLSKAASGNPVMLGGLAGFGAGCLTAAAYSLHCTMDASLYICAYYFLPIFLLSAASALFASKFLRW